MTKPLGVGDVFSLIGWFMSETAKRTALASEALIEGEPEPEPVDLSGRFSELGLDLEGLTYTAQRLTDIGAALGAIRSEVHRRISNELGDGGFARFGPTVVRYGVGSPTLKLRKGEESGFFAYLSNPRDIAAVVSVSYVRKTPLRVIAETKGVDVEVLVDTFLDKSWSKPSVLFIPQTASDRYSDLEEGEVRRRSDVSGEEVA